MAQLPDTAGSTITTIENTENKEIANNRKDTGCDESKAILNGDDNNVICMIRRKRASNLVIYRAKTVDKEDSNGNIATYLDSKQPIEIFWLKLSKQDLKKHRDSGKSDDRVEISKIERKLAYGVSVKKIINNKGTNKKWSRWSHKSKKDKLKTNNTNDGEQDNDDEKEVNANNEDEEDRDSYNVVFNALKSMRMILRIDPNDNKPNLYGNIMIDDNEIECILKEIWVTMRKSTRMGIPKIDYLTIKANRCDNKQWIEHVMKK